MPIFKIEFQAGSALLHQNIVAEDAGDAFDSFHDRNPSVKAGAVIAVTKTSGDASTFPLRKGMEFTRWGRTYKITELTPSLVRCQYRLGLTETGRKAHTIMDRAEVQRLVDRQR